MFQQKPAETIPRVDPPTKEARKSETPKEQAKPKRKPFSELCGQDLTFQTRIGTIVEGHVTGTESGYFLLKNVRIVGKDHEARVPWTWLNQAVVAHIHPAGAAVTRREADA
ncbi:hypothetical protein [Desulforhabdus amnigena]|uniref:hypothetical protein n=1 Tax=Desulforhabdus amnigena TaxID=40218 RepID=UPI0024919FB3|nr:hypothetical protein [Desulforhabdus amnigena]